MFTNTHTLFRTNSLHPHIYFSLKKKVFANKSHSSFPIKWDCCKHSMAHDSWEAEKVYHLHYLSSISIGKADS